MKALAPGDVVITPAVDRLSRDTTDLLVIACEMQRAGAGIRSLAEPYVDKTSDFAKIVFTFSAAPPSWNAAAFWSARRGRADAFIVGLQPVTSSTLANRVGLTRNSEAKFEMSQCAKHSVRDVLLEEIKAQAPRTQIDAPLSQRSVLNAAARKLGSGYDDQIILTQWGELFRTGLLAWGLNLSNPDPPFFHLTERGRLALASLTRDPSSPAGYLRHLASIAALDAVAMSYLVEALECYVAGLYKSAAVMVGGAAESIILDLRNLTVQQLASLDKPIPRDMRDWKIKTVSDTLRSFFEGHKTQMSRELRESFEAYWLAFAQQIRAVRNDAGHPTSVEPVTPDMVHASLLIFPELARLASGLSRWVADDLT